MSHKPENINANPDAEHDIIGRIASADATDEKAMLVADVADILPRSMAFTIEPYRRIWRAVLHLFSEGRPIVDSHIRELSGDSLDHVKPIMLARDTVIESARIVRRHWEKRVAISGATKLLQELRQGDLEPHQVGEFVADEIEVGRDALPNAAEIFDESVAALDNEDPPQRFRRMNHEILDPVFGGIPDGSDNVLMGFSGHGKTTIAAIMCQAFLRANPTGRVLWASVESTLPQLTARLAAAASKGQIPERELIEGATGDTKDQIKRAAPDVSKLLERVDFLPIGSVSVERIGFEMRKLSARYPKCAKWNFIDYIQAVQSEKKNFYRDNERIAYVMARVSHLGQQYGVTKIILSQITPGDEVEQRVIAMPNKYSVRGSKDIPQYADKFAIWHRPYANQNDVDDRKSDYGILQMQKNRFGREGAYATVKTNLANKSIKTWQDPGLEQDVPSLWGFRLSTRLPDDAVPF